MSHVWNDEDCEKSTQVSEYSRKPTNRYKYYKTDVLPIDRRSRRKIFIQFKNKLLLQMRIIVPNIVGSSLYIYKLMR